MKYDLHTHTEYSDGHLTVREQIRSAEGMGLDYLAITDHYYDGMPLDPALFEKYIKEIESENDQSSVHVFKGLEVTVVNTNGDLSCPGEIMDRVDIVLAELSRTTEGVFVNPPGDRHKLIDNVTKCMIEGCRHDVVDAFAHPFNVGKLAIPLRPLEFTEPRIQEIARVFFETNTAFNIITPMVLWYPHMTVIDISQEYTQIVRIFASEGVRFFVGSDDHWTGVGNTAWAERILEAAGVPEEQYFDPGSYIEAT